MSIATNATIGQFTAAYAAALSSLGIECAPQMLHYSDGIIYGEEATGPDEPFVKIDGSRSTGARNEYIAISVPKEKIFVEPKDRDVSVLDPTSSFLDEIDRFDEVLDSSKIDIIQSFAGRDHEGLMVTAPSLREVLKTLSLLGDVVEDLSADVLKALPESNVSDEYREGVKGAAYDFATWANDKLMPGQRDYLKAAELFFAAGALFAGLADEKSIDRAVEMFAESAKQFYMTKDHRVSAAAVTEILAWLKKDDPKWSNAYLVQAADRWEEAAIVLHGRGDVFAATIAVYRGLRAAALSSHHEAMKVLFDISSRINLERKNTEGLIGDYLRGALMILSLHEDGRAPDEKLAWEEAYCGLHLAFELMKDEGMIDALKPFLDVAKERSGRALQMEIRQAALKVVSDPEIIPPSESDDLLVTFDEIVEEAVEHYMRVTDAGGKITPETAAREIVQKRHGSYIDLAYTRYREAFEGGRISGHPCSRDEFAKRGKDKKNRFSIYSRFLLIEAMGIEPGMEIINGKIEAIRWDGMVKARWSNGNDSVAAPHVMAVSMPMQKKD